jgi:hypothetical protein
MRRISSSAPPADASLRRKSAPRRRPRRRPKRQKRARFAIANLSPLRSPPPPLSDPLAYLLFANSLKFVQPEPLYPLPLAPKGQEETQGEQKVPPRLVGRRR